MDFQVSLAFENINNVGEGSTEAGYGVDHVKLAESLGCKAIRIRTPEECDDAFARAEAMMEEHQVPVVMEFILERVTNISMGTEIDDINEFEEILCLDPSLTLESGWVSMGEEEEAEPEPELEPA